MDRVEGGNDFILIGEVLGAVLPAADSVSVLLGGSWREAAGDEAAVHSMPLKLRGDTLVIGVSSPAWGQVLSLREEELLRRLTSAPCCSEIKRLAFRPTADISRTEEHGSEDAGKETDNSTAESETTAEAIERLLGETDDPRLRATVTGALRAWLTRGGGEEKADGR